MEKNIYNAERSRPSRKPKYCYSKSWDADYPMVLDQETEITMSFIDFPARKT